MFHYSNVINIFKFFKKFSKFKSLIFKDWKVFNFQKVDNLFWVNVTTNSNVYSKVVFDDTDRQHVQAV